MNMAFSTFSGPLWPRFKAISKDRSESAFFDVFGSIWRATPYAPPMDPDMVYASIYALFLWKYCRITHYFLSSGVAEFCESAVRDLSHDFAKALPECTSIDTDGKQFHRWLVAVDDTKKAGGGFAIHFPAKTGRRSIIVMPSQIIPSNARANGVNGVEVRKYWFAADDGEDVALCNKDSTGIDWCDSAKAMVKTIYGLALYLDAFPETATKATRYDVKDVAHYAGNAFTVAANESAREDVARSVSPHFRRGHFRMLTSEMFRRKRGQVVFVRGSFVRGHAVDVGPDLSPSQPVT